MGKNDKLEEKMKKGKKEEKFDIKELYTPLSVAKKEIWRRWNDKELIKKVEDFLGGDIPKFLKKKPRVVLSRDIISPNKEFFYFLDLIKQVDDISPAFIEYLDGKFVARNFNKYHLCRMFFHNGIGKKRGDIMETLNVVNFNKEEGKKIKKVKTIFGEKLVSFHHNLLNDSIKGFNKKDIFDFSKWFNCHRKKTKFYYLHYLALFLTHGILFDNFIASKGEEEFTNEKIIPSFKKLEEIFGIKPLVVPLTPVESEDDLYWWCYPCSTKKNIEKRIK